MFTRKKMLCGAYVIAFTFFVGVPVKAEAWESFSDCSDLLYRTKYEGKLTEGMHLWSIEFKNIYDYEIRFSWGLGARNSTGPIAYARHGLSSGGTRVGSEHLPTDDYVHVYIADVEAKDPTAGPEDTQWYAIDNCPATHGTPHISEKGKNPVDKKPPQSNDSSYEATVGFHRMMCSKGDHLSCMALAEAFENGDLGFAEDKNEAWKYYGYACDEGSVIACVLRNEGKEQYLSDNTAKLPAPEPKKSTAQQTTKTHNCPNLTDDLYFRIMEEIGFGSRPTWQECTVEINSRGDHVEARTIEPSSGCFYVSFDYEADEGMYDRANRRVLTTPSRKEILNASKKDVHIISFSSTKATYPIRFYDRKSESTPQNRILLTGSNQRMTYGICYVIPQSWY